MNRISHPCIATLHCAVLVLAVTSHAATNYVGTAGTPSGNYYTDIQSAVSASSAGDVVLVSNGVYGSGQTVTPGYALANRVLIDRDIIVRSVDGPANTVILGQGPNGTGAVRGVLMTTGTLNGFTISNGHTLTSGSYFFDRSGGGVLCTDACVVANCILAGNAADYDGGGVFCLAGGLVDDCMLRNNAAHIGGGVFCIYGGTVANSTLTGNRADYGGGVQCSYEVCQVSNCLINGNSAGIGGGARCYDGNEVVDCIIVSNRADAGGGVHCDGAGFVNNCTIYGNSAKSGGGVYCYDGGEVNNCAVGLNRAFAGGGVYLNGDGEMNNCTLSGNDAFAGGGVLCDGGGSLKNTIISANTALVFDDWLNYDVGMSYAYCCTTPDPGGTGNITNDPVLANFAHIATNSPCIGMGTSAAATGVDIDGNAWLTPPAIGCDQPTLAGLTGTLSVTVLAEMTNLTVGARCRFTGYVEGMADMVTWWFGEGAMYEGLSYATSHAWNTPGVYAVVLTAFNTDNLAGVAGTVTVHVVAASTHYVAAANASPAWPYRSWATAATNIQDAIDACFLGGKVMVTNGVYATGAKSVPGALLSNRVTLTKDIPVTSVNGPDVTCILGTADPLTGGNGTNATRCVYMSAGTLTGFTISNGHTLTYADYDYDMCGGGVLLNFFGSLSNCVIAGNSADALAGGVYCCYGGELNDCEITANRAFHGGGISCYVGGSISNSIVNNNAAQVVSGNGGGVMCEYGGVLNNCTIKNNVAGKEGGGVACYNGGLLRNSKILANVASNLYGTAGSGGGIYGYKGGNAYNCEIADNTAATTAGGVLLFNTALNSCTLSGNRAGTRGGGVFCSVGAAMTNCIVYFNTAPLGDNYYDLTTTNYIYCCTTPEPGGYGSITNDPLFVNPGAGNYHLLEWSPCIDAGTNLPWMTGVTDLEGNPRIHDGTVDIGCYEYIPEPGMFLLALPVIVALWRFSR